MKTVKCRKVGGSFITTIPRKYVRKLNIKEGDEFDITENRGTIILSPIKKKLRGEVYIEDITGKNIEDIGLLGSE